MQMPEVPLVPSTGMHSYPAGHVGPGALVGIRIFAVSLYWSSKLRSLAFLTPLNAERQVPCVGEHCCGASESEAAARRRCRSSCHGELPVATASLAEAPKAAPDAASAMTMRSSGGGESALMVHNAAFSTAQAPPDESINCYCTGTGIIAPPIKTRWLVSCTSTSQ